MSVTFALAIPHTPWVLERVDSLSRLLSQLDARLDGPRILMIGGLWRGRLFAEREPNWSWSEKLWTWAAETGATHLLQLQDDVEVAPDFWKHLRAMVEALPDQVIGLESACDRVAEMARYREIDRCLNSPDWCTTSDGLIGVGYVVPLESLRAFVAWRREQLKAGAVEAIHEDNLLGLWCFATGRRIWHPVPTIIDHDTSIPSTYGNDAHKNRRPRATWKDTPLREHLGTIAEHAGLYYESTPQTALRWIKGATPELVLEMCRDADPALVCGFCDAQIRSVRSGKTGASLCKMCLVKCMAHVMGLQVQYDPSADARS